MESPDYTKHLSDAAITDPVKACSFFRERIMDIWLDSYWKENPIAGDITWQNFQGFTFVFEYTSNNEEYPASSLPDSRVLAAFGISNLSVNPTNREMMKKYIGASAKAYAHFGNNYDKGHFIAHHSGGPIDINLFPHRKDVNRGWKPMGKYRSMEKHVAANPGTFVFSRPIYDDFSCRPSFLEYGYYDTANNFDVAVFPNKND